MPPSPRTCPPARPAANTLLNCPQTKLFVLSDPPITQVFSDKTKKTAGEITDHQRSVMDDLGLSADKVGASSIFTGDEEVFAFARAVVRQPATIDLSKNPLLLYERALTYRLFVVCLQSRLTEMGSVQWSQVHKA